MEFMFDLVANGLLVGLMYALVALGFVLIYKATSVINFAQGDLLMFAGYAAAVMTGGHGMPLWAMVLVLCAGMVVLGFVLERGILRPMVGQPVVSVIMVTVGLGFVLQGLVTIIWGASTRELALPVRFEPYIVGPVFISPINLVAAVIAVLFLIAFGLFFTRSRLGVAMRAVADDQQASMVVGIKVPRVFALSWAIAGLAAAAGGIIWGNQIGVDTFLALVGLKGLSGGHSRRAGQHWRRHHRRPADGRHRGPGGWLSRPLVGGGTKDFIPYVLMILVLFVRPYGFFGHETIERV